MAANRRKTRLTPAQAKNIVKRSNQRTNAIFAQIGSTGEETLARHLQVKKIPYQREYAFHPTRKFRADFYLADYRLLIEVEGGTKGKSRHTSHKGYSRDQDKYNAAAILGFSRLAFTTEQVCNGTAIQTIETFIQSAPLRRNEYYEQGSKNVVSEIIHSIKTTGRFNTPSGEFFAHHVPSFEAEPFHTPEAILQATKHQ